MAGFSFPHGKAVACLEYRLIDTQDRPDEPTHSTLVIRMRIIVNIVGYSGFFRTTSPPMSRRIPSNSAWLAHYGKLLGLWRRSTHGREDGEDAVQDVVLGMLENGVGTIGDPRAYLSRGTANRIVSRHRHRNALAMAPLDEVTEQMHPGTASAEQAFQARQLADALVAALEELPPKCRQVYVQHRLEGRTHTEIAQQLGLSRSMVEKYMTRALRHLNERLRNHVPY